MDKNFIKADLHIHSSFSDGIASPEEIVKYVANYTDLKIIAITDHDNIKGSLKAVELGEKYGIIVVPGVEVTTLQGHVICLFIDKHIRKFTSLYKTIEITYESGGIIVLPHPMSPLTYSIPLRCIKNIFKKENFPKPDAIEIINPTLAGRVIRQKVVELNKTLKLAELAGTDSHTLDTIGSAYTLFPENTKNLEDVKRAIINRQTKAYGEFWSIREHLRIARTRLNSDIKNIAQKIGGKLINGNR
ncbi:PHP domain protein [Thermodesulfobium narugense DSM 14796]|uniref:PHP domain protein n=1 Tax=Thermodesulfobium narugense DSM 14796 TaxID=747365 RepID=M1E4J3_9BACT|nr:PHP-associated domain-containing protein [Thermodesulfobium narugense]AEE14217.1 PHP domain protein [Thermodesulfobium narugense DSM 14796]